MSLGDNKKGFGIVEVLLAGVIIITMLVALVYVARGAINGAIYSKQRVQAVFLAQEGIETIRQIRDSNYVDGKPSTKWNTLTGETSIKEVETISSNGRTLNDPYCIRKNINNSTLRYHMVDCADDKVDPERSGNFEIDGVDYTRYIHFYPTGTKLLTDPSGIKLPQKNSYRVVIFVRWNHLGDEKEIRLDEVIANSRQAW